MLVKPLIKFKFSSLVLNLKFLIPGDPGAAPDYDFGDNMKQQYIQAQKTVNIFFKSFFTKFYISQRKIVETCLEWIEHGE